jgi:Ricin-type beta-trefoil lectin domain-like
VSNRAITAVLAAALTAAVAVAVGPTAAHAEAADKAPVPIPISSVLSPSLSRSAATGWYPAIVNTKSNEYLEPNGIAVGAPILQQDPFHTSRQTWLFGINTDETANFFQNGGVVLNMGTAGGSTANDTSVVLVTPSSSLDQQWLLKDTGDGIHFWFENRKNASMCLGIDGASINPGARAALYNCDLAHTRSNQVWFFAAAP